MISMSECFLERFLTALSKGEWRRGREQSKQNVIGVEPSKLVGARHIRSARYTCCPLGERGPALPNLLHFRLHMGERSFSLAPIASCQLRSRFLKLFDSKKKKSDFGVNAEKIKDFIVPKCFSKKDFNNFDF